MTLIADQTNECLSEVRDFVNNGGAQYCEAAIAAVSETIGWIHYFQATNGERHATELLAGARASAIEAASYISLGLGRAAITAIRGQVDLLLGFTYFRDHPAEWEFVERTGDGFRLRSAIHRYHEETTPGFASRWSMIRDKSKYQLPKLYQILSSHIHGQTTLTIPKSNQLKEVVTTAAYVRSIVELQLETTIALSNFLTAVYAPQWPELPIAIVTRVRNLLSPNQRPEFFAD